MRVETNVSLIVGSRQKIQEKLAQLRRQRKALVAKK